MKMLDSFKNRIVLSTLLLFSSILAFAQDKKVDVDIDVNKGNQSQWYTQPWVWIVGGAVFIILIVALTRGGRKE
jgi:cell division protein FtsW (lipid II flippase)